MRCKESSAAWAENQRKLHRDTLGTERRAGMHCVGDEASEREKETPKRLLGIIHD